MSNIQTYVLKVSISSEKDCKKVKKALCNINGVHDTHIEIEEGKVTITGNPDLYIILKKLSKVGKHAELLTMNSMDQQKQQQRQQQLNSQYDDAHRSDEYHHADAYPSTVTKYPYETTYSSIEYHHEATSSSNENNHEAVHLSVGYHHEDIYPPVATRYPREASYTPIQYHQKTNHCESSYIPSSRDEWESYTNMFNDENPNNKCSIM